MMEGAVANCLRTLDAMMGPLKKISKVVRATENGEVVGVADVNKSYILYLDR